MQSRWTERRQRFLLASITTLFLVLPTQAIWPFPPKRFTGNALINAGSMGLNDDGRVIAFGDFNGDQLCAQVILKLVPVITLLLKPRRTVVGTRPANAVGPSLESW
jgi:hypothetical protein